MVSITGKTACRCGIGRTLPLSEPPRISTIHPPEVLNMEFSVVLWRRGVPVGVVYTGNNAMFGSEVFPQWTRTGGRMVLIQGGYDDGGVCPVPDLQAVFSVPKVHGFFGIKV